jgi:hypothetical protein
MPLEISEIGIRLSVGEPAAQSPSAPPPDSSAPSGLTPHEIDELVRRCVSEVIDTLRLLSDR